MTGHFTREAVEYAEKLKSRGIIVELFDFPILNDMAQRAGIKLLHEGQSFPIHTFYVSDPAGVSVKIANAVFPRMISAPLSPSAIASIEPRVLELRTAYLIQYNVHENFDTSIGRVHSVHQTISSSLLMEATESYQILALVNGYCLLGEQTGYTLVIRVSRSVGMSSG